MRPTLAAGALALAFALGCMDDLSEVETAEPDTPYSWEDPDDEPDECTPPASCCAVCQSGKACGDACISSSATCNTIGGCACNFRDVCQ